MNKLYINIRNHLLLSYVFLSLSLLGFSSFALAEAADRDKPIDLEADSVKVDDAKQISTYSGNVILTQGTLIIRADKLIVREDTAGFQHSTSLGNPTTFKQKREGKNEYMEGSAQRIEYDGRMDKVQLFTKASVKRGEDIVHGDYISYDANAEYAEVIGGTKSADGTTSSGRVHAIIQPKNKKAADPATENAKPASSPSSSNQTTGKDVRLSRTLEVSPDAQ
jgi:lipopolysaccharide export system protein LptA